jgi:hypothetical protein
MQARVRSAMLSAKRAGVWAMAAQAKRPKPPTSSQAVRRVDLIHREKIILMR